MYSRVLACLFLIVGYATALDLRTSSHHPKYQTLPPLREQKEIQNAWTASRVERVPALLRKHGVDAWLVTVIPRTIHTLNLIVDR